MRNGIYSSFFLVAGLLGSCGEQEFVETPSAQDPLCFALDEGKACAAVVPFELDNGVHSPSSRTDIIVNPDPVNGGVSFNWNATDSLGVFPINGYQAAFSLDGQIEQNKAVFDGGTWLLRDKSTYAAYYPFSEKAYDLPCYALEANYGTLTQQGNNKTTHLAVHDYLACPFSEVSAAQRVNFTLSHLGSLMRFVINAPADATWDYFRLKGAANEFIVDATFNLYQTTPVLLPVSTADTVRINMQGITTTGSSREIILYTMIASNQNAVPDEWCITMSGSAGIFRDTLRDYTDGNGTFHDIARILVPGKAYNRTVSFNGANSTDDWTMPINGDENYDPNEPILAPGYIGIQAATYEFEEIAESRMDVVRNGGSLSFAWAADDVLGVFPNQGNQTAFPLSSQAGETLALFDGNDWALRDGWDYAAYFPFSQANFHLSPRQLPVSFEGQKLDGNDPLANPGKYNYCFAPLTTVSDNQPIRFAMQGLASMVNLTFTSPVSDSFYLMTMERKQQGIVHHATYNLLSMQPQLVSADSEGVGPMLFDMVNYRMAIGETRDAYLMLMPGDYTSEEILFTFYGSMGKVCRATYTPKNSFSAGKGYHIKLQLEELENNEQNNIN